MAREPLRSPSAAPACREKLDALEGERHRKDAFLAAIRRFMEMETLTAPLLHELIDHIDVYETEGTGKNRTQRVVIYYRFVGYIELPDAAFRSEGRYRADIRQGVAVEYIPKVSVKQKKKRVVITSNQL